jgi:predicted  nucleic acid-binding Zn-ribbon protein
LRKSLEGIQSKQDTGASEEPQSKHEEEIRSLREELDEANEGKEHFETQYKNLLGRVNTIKTSLGDRLKADAVCASQNLRFTTNCTSYRARLLTIPGPNRRVSIAHFRP